MRYHVDAVYTLTLNPAQASSRANAVPGAPEFESHLSSLKDSYHGTVVLFCNFALLTHGQAAQQSQGIQTLLEAEKDAAKVVQESRQCTYAFPISISTLNLCRHRSSETAERCTHGSR